MSTTELKNKINQSLEKLDVLYLESAHLILQELVNQQKHDTVAVDKIDVDAKIIKGIKQLNNGESTNFGLFLKEMQANYGKKK